MRRFGLMAMLLLGTMGGAMAQGMPDGNGPGGEGMRENHGHHSEMRACMKEHLGSVREQIHAGMEKFRQANPDATREAKKAERHRLMEPFREQIHAAREACHNTEH